MKSRYRRLICLAGAFILLAGSMPGARASGDLESRQDRIDAIEEEQDRVQKKLDELNENREDASAYIEGINEELSQTEDSLNELQDKMEETQAEIEAAQAELEAAKETETEQYDQMKLRIQYMYEKGDTYFLELLFDSADLSDFLNQAEYISRISEYDRNMLTAYQETKQTIADKTEELEAAYAGLDTLKEEAVAKQESLVTLQEAKTEELQNLNEQISENQDLMADYDEALKGELEEFRAMEEAIREQEAKESAEASLAAEKTEAETTLVADGGKESTAAPAEKPESSEGTQPTQTEAPTKAPTEAPTKPPVVNTGFIWPVPSCSRISSGYGGRDDPITGESDGTLSDHHGIDIALPGGALAGAPIVAAADGEVIISRFSSSAGNWIILYHGNSTYTVYMHCQKLLVSAGDTVSQGETIGLVGSTGWSTGPHLHFEVRVGGFSTSAYSRNPLNYVSPP